ncbi:MAG: phenylalanine--tRNA ligase subunit beta [Candidatus Kapaibacterium sp.]
MPNKKIIESWLKSITPHSYTPAELAELLMRRGIEVESIDDRFSNLAGFVVGQVLTCEKHPDADKLSVTTVTTGGESSTVVCGAPNVRAGQKIAFAPVGLHIATAGFTIGKRKIRGIESAGMICSESELGLSDDHDGILVLPPDTPVGVPVADILGDVIYEIDVTPNRADCLSHLGIAREVAALTGGEIFLPPTEFFEAGERTEDAVTITIDDPALCPRYVARMIRGVKIGPSPAWLQETLRKLGLRPRNNVVDITSYVLFECGHPLHAFDFDRLAGGRVEVKAVYGGKFVTLDGKEHELPDGALMICDAEKPVAIAGVMGGENSEITDDTVNVLLESAFFNPSSIRRTAKRLGISTDASFRFERGADINNTIYAVNRAAQLIAGLAGGEVLAGPLDIYPDPSPETLIELRCERADEILGITIPDELQMEYLRRIGFGVEPRDGRRAMVTVPSFRVDIFGEIDLIEEIVRIHGYDNLPAEPRASVTFDLATDQLQKLIATSRHFLIDSGFNETVALYLTDPETAAAYGSPVELRNGLGRDFSMLRTSVVPSMAKVIGFNQRYSLNNLRLFETGTAFRASGADKGIIPGVVEMTELSIAMSGAAEPQGWDVAARNSDLSDLRGMLDRYFDRVGVLNVAYRAADDAKWGFDAPALSIHVGNAEVGRAGRFDPELTERHDIAGAPVIAVIDLERLAEHAFTPTRYKAPSKFPVVLRDISIVVDAERTNAELEKTILGAGGALLSNVRLFDLYQGKGMEPGKKSVAYSLSFTSYERTLEDGEIEKIVGKIVRKLDQEHGAKLRGA